MLSLVKYVIHARYKSALQNIKEKIHNTRPLRKKYNFKSCLNLMKVHV